MRAHSIEQEIDIRISHEELKRMSESPIIGKIKRFSNNEFHSEIDLNLFSGQHQKKMSA